MTDAIIIRRLAVLEREVQSIKSHMRRATTAPAKDAKKLPHGLQIALREAGEGKLSGPFNTVEDFMAHLDQ